MADHPGYHLAQINIGTLIADPDDPAVAEFMDNLGRVNAAADTAPGFVWRLQSDSGNATDVRAFANPRVLVNMSVWTSVDALRDYAYRGDHVDFFRRRAAWFEPDAKRVALWWVPTGHLPSVTDGVRRADFVERHGPSPYAFGFARQPLPLVIEETSYDDADTQALVNRLNDELTELADNPCENHFGLTAAETTGNEGRMLRAVYDGRMVGCGAVRRIGPETGEIKRMFVDDTVRGLKIGGAILDRLEDIAASLGITELKLETSERQPAAIALYERAGFQRCELWGEYLETAATSVGYGKVLAST